MPRIFVAIDLPDPVRQRIADLCYGVNGARWVPIDQMHLTLRFAGEVDETTFSDVVEALVNVEEAPFVLALKGSGHFPPRRDPRVLWIGVQENPVLARLGQKVEDALAEVGVETEDRKFHPHITVARLRDFTKPNDVIPFLQQTALFTVESIPVREFHLYSSELSRDGATHTIERTYHLA